MSSRLETITNVVLVATCAVVAFALRRREAATPPPASASSALQTTEFSRWDSLVAVSRPLTPRVADDTVIILTDLECPFCRSLHRDLVTPLLLRADAPSVLVAHMPLGMHRFARPAARAATCVPGTAEFSAFVDQVYNLQDSLGLVPWSTIAARAGVADTNTLGTCMARMLDSGDVLLERTDRILGSEFPRVTPTVLLNGRLLSTPPSRTQLDSLRRRRPAGR